MKLFVLLAVVLISIAGVSIFLKPEDKQSEGINQISPLPTSTQTPFKASFAIFTNGTFRVFTDPKYHNLSDDVYIESDSPNVITVNKNGITWRNFFDTLPMKLEKDCLTTGTGQVFCTSGSAALKFYINGKEDSNALEKQINPGDKLLVSFGEGSEQEVQNQLKEIPSN